MGCASSSETGDAGSKGANASTAGGEERQATNAPKGSPAKPAPVAVTAVEELGPIEQSPMPAGKKVADEPGELQVTPSQSSTHEEANRLLAVGGGDQLRDAPPMESPTKAGTVAATDPHFTGVMEVPSPQAVKPSTPPNATKAPSLQHDMSGAHDAGSGRHSLAATTQQADGMGMSAEQRNVSIPRQSDPQDQAGSAPTSQPQPPGEPPAPDPWADLQSQYQLKDADDFKPSSSGRVSGTGKGSLAASRQNSRNRSKGSAEMLELDDDEGELRPHQLNGSQATAGSRHKARGRLQGLPPAAPKKGGWGQGSMAAAGTLMLGEDEEALMHGKSSSIRRTDDVDVRMADNELKTSPSPPSAKAARKVEDDLGMEDIDDVDALLAEEEQNGGLNKDLATKLKAFEAMQDDDDD